MTDSHENALSLQPIRPNDPGTRVDLSTLDSLGDKYIPLLLEDEHNHKFVSTSPFPSKIAPVTYFISSPYFHLFYYVPKQNH